MGTTSFHRWLRTSPTCLLRQALLEPTTLRSSPRRSIATDRGYIFSQLHPNHVEEEDVASRKRRGYHRPMCKELQARPAESESYKILHKIALLTGDIAIFSLAGDQAFDILLSQANVQAMKTKLTSLVDKPEHRENMKLWIEILNYRYRLDGFDGVLAVWQDLRKRNIDLPTQGEDADILWPTFIHACVAEPMTELHEDYLTRILNYAKSLKSRRGNVYASLYACVIGRWLRIQSLERLEHWHSRLADFIEPADVDLSVLAEDFALNPGRPTILFEKKKDEGSFEQFRTIYQHFKANGLYDHYIPQLLERHKPSTVLRWHKFFLEHADAPSSQVFAMPAVQILFELDGNMSLPMVHKQPDDDSKTRPVIDSKEAPVLTRSKMSAIVGEVHGIKQKEMSDYFVAKMFATRAFPLDMVVTGLSFFGVERLGPLALHEMAVRAESAGAFCTKSETLKGMGISISESVYGRLLEKVAAEMPHLYDALIASDEHPEMFEDAATQERLLASFLERGDNVNAHLALLALSMTGQKENVKAWNRVLQHYILARDYRAASKLIEHMKASKMYLGGQTLSMLHRHFLPTRNVSKAPHNGLPEGAEDIAPLQFTTNAFIYAAECGVDVHYKLWRENIKRFGMLHRWEELERLVLWMASFYSTRGLRGHVTHDHGKHVLRTESLLELVFNTVAQKALIIWSHRIAGIRRVLKPRNESEKGTCEPWARGILLLKRLDKAGVKISAKVVRQALVLNMWTLFGPAYSKRNINRDVKRYNELSLAHYIKYANELWDGKLFDLDPSLYEPSNHPDLLVAVFGRTRSTDRLTGEKADVVAYAEFLRSGGILPDSRVSFRRAQYWQRSPFRILPEKLSKSASLADHNRPHRRPRQSPPAQSSSSYPPPNPEDTQGPVSSYSPLQP
ncbi:hypothetical protein AC578_9052 [Pseudocercospora eumusae]|uniref:Uncharacterized protein n=1 Tax=Pseudocercospora eumusae TaxID=321146 RepID=A0A139H8L9_9PEZI|nr:hypothetical protein AC578_9052 [Pseudocercospora eumusae]